MKSATDPATIPVIDKLAHATVLRVCPSRIPGTRPPATAAGLVEELARWRERLRADGVIETATDPFTLQCVLTGPDTAGQACEAALVLDDAMTNAPAAEWFSFLAYRLAVATGSIRRLTIASGTALVSGRPVHIVERACALVEAPGITVAETVFRRCATRPDFVFTAPAEVPLTPGEVEVCYLLSRRTGGGVA